MLHQDVCKTLTAYYIVKDNRVFILAHKSRGIFPRCLPWISDTLVEGQFGSVGKNHLDVVQDLRPRTQREAPAADALVAAPQTRLPGVLPPQGVAPALASDGSAPGDPLHRFDLGAGLQHRWLVGNVYFGEARLGCSTPHIQPPMLGAGAKFHASCAKPILGAAREKQCNKVKQYRSAVQERAGAGGDGVIS